MKSVDAWLHRTGAKVEHEHFDRIAEVILEGVATVADGQPKVAETMTVLVKTMAMVIGRTLEADMPEEEAEVYFTGIGDALRLEVTRFRRALAADIRHGQRRCR